MEKDRKQVIDILVTGLARLEYRGYDSAGIAIDGDTEKDTIEETYTERTFTEKMAREESLADIDGGSVIQYHGGTSEKDQGGTATDWKAHLAHHPCASGCGHYCWAANDL